MIASDNSMLALQFAEANQRQWCVIFQVYKSQQGANVTVQFRQHYLTLLNDFLILSVEKSPVNDVVNILWRYAFNCSLKV